jgi:tetratricopeptide (TPR) repeat protein
LGEVGEPKASREGGLHSAVEPAKAALAAFRAVLAADPPHPDEPAVRLTVANLRFAAGEVTEAAREFKRVRESHPPEPVMVAATYNLGLVRHRDREWAVARQLFSDAADLGAHTPAAAVAWWWVGRTELDVGNLDACAAAWNRADESPDKEITAAALLGRVFLKLLNGETERAEKFLHGQRLANVDPIPALGEVFHGYFRFAAKPTELNRSELVTAIRHADLGKPFGPAGQLMFGGWLGEAGEGKEMLAVYEAAAETARGEWAVRLALGAGEYHYSSGDRTAAKCRFVAVAATDSGEYGDRARVRLAELALTAGRADECVAYCRQVLNRDHTDRSDTLRLLGRGYEQLNRPRAAAECFAGRLPTQ